MKNLIIGIFVVFIPLISQCQIIKTLPGSQGDRIIVDSEARSNAQLALDSAIQLRIRLDENFTEMDEKVNEVNALKEATDDAVFRYLSGQPGDTTTPPPPPPADTANILFQQDFQNTTIGEYNLTEWRRDWNNPAWANHTLGYGYIEQSGSNKYIRVSFPAGTFGLAQHGIQWNTYFSAVNTGYTDLWFTYKVKFSSGWNGTLQLDGKLPGLAANVLTSGGITGQQLIDGLPGLTARYMFNKGATDLRFYMYYSDMHKAFGDNTPIPTKTYYGASVLFSNEPGPNVWFTVTEHVRLNTFTGSTPNSDGYIEGYINGIRRAYQGNLKWRTSSNVLLNFITIALFLGGSGVPTQSQEYIYLDDFVVYQKL